MFYCDLMVFTNVSVNVNVDILNSFLHGAYNGPPQQGLNEKVRCLLSFYSLKSGRNRSVFAWALLSSTW